MKFTSISKTAAMFVAVLLFVSPLAASAANTSVVISTPPRQTTVFPGSSVAFTISASGFTAPTYRVSDSFASGSISNSDITNTGEFSWIPSASDVGTHSLTITVSDQNNSQSVHITFVVTTSFSVGGVLFGPPSPSSTLTVGQTLTFWTSASGFPETPMESVTDTFANSTVSNSAITDSQQFTWTATAQDVGTHTITLTAKDREGDVAQQSITVVVNPAAQTTSTVTNNASVSSPQTSAAPTTFTQYLVPGSENAQVLALQKVLASLGLLSVAPNGYFGVNTEKAVLAFQAAHKLSQLGVVGPATRAALNAIAAPSSTSAAQTASQNLSLAQQLAQLQAQLAALTAK